MGMRDASCRHASCWATEDITAWDTRRRREAGIGYIPEDRHRHGLLLDAPLWENRILGHQTQAPSASRAAGSTAAARARTPSASSSEYDVRTPGIDTLARALSGGNQQKLIVGREMSGDPVAADRRPPHPRRRRRRAGRDLGPHQEGPARRAGGAADLRRPRRADRPVRPDRGHPARPAGRRASTRPTVTPQDLGSAMTGGGESGMTPSCAGSASPCSRPCSRSWSRWLVTSLVILAHRQRVGRRRLLEHHLLQAARTGAWSTSSTRPAMIYLSAVAAAIGFRMGPVQHRRRRPVHRRARSRPPRSRAAAFLPGFLNVLAILVVAIVVGALWAGIAGSCEGDPRRQRGHLDDHAQRHRRASWSATCQQVRPARRQLRAHQGASREGAQVAGCIPFDAAGRARSGRLDLLAVLVGVGFWFLLNTHPLRLRPAGDRRVPVRGRGQRGQRQADGAHRDAALRRRGRADLDAGVLRRRLLLRHDFQTGLGFTGIAVALLGRNHPLGIVFGAAALRVPHGAVQLADTAHRHLGRASSRSPRASSCSRSSSPTSWSAATASGSSSAAVAEHAAPTQVEEVPA